MLSKGDRLKIFYQRLEEATRVETDEEAFQLLSNVLDGVEDEFSGIPNIPERWQTDGRMYPPQRDSERQVPGRTDVRRFRSKKHNMYFGRNGSILIESLEGAIMFKKPGKDGREIDDFK